MCADKEIIELEDLDDFEAQEATYQVWLFTYDKDNNLLNDLLLQEFDSPNKAVEHAQIYCATLQKLIDQVEKPIARCEVAVETVVDFGDYEENIATIFVDNIEI